MEFVGCSSAVGIIDLIRLVIAVVGRDLMDDGVGLWGQLQIGRGD